MTPAAQQALQEAQAVFGYTTYIDLVRPLVEDKKIVSTGMRQEVDRVRRALQAARQGSVCALVCSGDPGIYALAGLVFEMCRENSIPIGDSKDSLKLEVIPGVPALGAGSALLGSPLMTDFACISLSDLLTPWEAIEKRIQAAAWGDFVIVFYNPRSKKRNWQLETARKLILEHRSPGTPVGLVTSATRDEESVSLCTLDSLDCNHVGMQTTVFIGNSRTFIYDSRMITPRGYHEKYQLEMREA